MDTAARLPDRIAAAARQWPAAMGMALTRDPHGPLIPPSPTGLWLTDGLTARLNPRAALQALAAAIRAGAARSMNIRRPRWPHPHDLGHGHAGTCGAEQRAGPQDRPGVKGQSLLLSHAAPDSPQVFADGLHIVPHADGTTAIGSTSENTYDTVHPDHQAQDLLARAVAICPALADAPVLDIWAGLRPRARSRAPVLAPWPGRPGHLIVNGGFKIGFGMAPLIADLTARSFWATVGHPRPLRPALRFLLCPNTPGESTGRGAAPPARLPPARAPRTLPRTTGAAMTRLDHAFTAIDAANAQDPNLDDGKPANLLYGQRMTAEQQRLFPDADDVLRIACRGQHVERWLLPRPTIR